MSETQTVRAKASAPSHLLEAAQQVMASSYAPYSRFQVGAALEAEDGRVYTGCNVENSSYGLTICAERVALFKAVSEGQRRFKNILVLASSGQPVTPCGACRQTLREFCDEDFLVHSHGDDEARCFRLGDLLPAAFTDSDLA